jgi:hypothetical protein
MAVSRGGDHRTGRMAVALVVGGFLLGLTLLAIPAGATPWSGPEPTPTNLLFYLHNSSAGIPVGSASYLDVLSTADDNESPWSGTGAVTQGVHFLAVTFVAAPQFAGPLVLNGTLNANVYMNESGSSPTGGIIVLKVYIVNAGGGLTLAGTGPLNSATGLGPGGSTPHLVSLAGPTLSGTVAPGDSIQVNITINGNTAEGYGIWWGIVAGTTYSSTISIPVSTYLSISRVAVYGANGSTISILPTVGSGRTVTVMGTVTDPLGAYDFESYSVNFSVATAAGTTVFGPVPMAPTPGLAAPGALNGAYDLTYNYSALTPGSYSFTATATDNTNHHLNGQDTLPVYFGRVASGDVVVTVGLPPVNVHVVTVDDHHLPLAGATVRVFFGGSLIAVNRTDGSGQAGFELAKNSTVAFSVGWEGVPAGNFSETISISGEQFELNASVIYPTFRLVTTNDQPVPYALVTLVHPNRTILPVIVTDGTGAFTLAQVPAGSYALTAIYDDSVVVASRPVSATTDGPITVVVGGVFTLTVSATASTGSGVSGVFVQVINTTTGAPIASGTTDASGTLAFLVPTGNYTVVGSWSATYDLTSVQQTETASVSVTGVTSAHLTFSKAFPAFTTTNEFFLIVGNSILGLLIVLVAILILRRRRGARPPSPSPSEPSTNPAGAWDEGGSR